MSTPSVTPEPTAAPTPGPAPRRRSAAAIVFGVLTAVFAVAAAGTGWLYLQARTDLDTANTAVAQLEEKLTVSEAALSDAEEDLDSCTSAVQGFLDLAIAAGVSGEIPNETEAASLMLDLIDSCPGVKFDLSKLLEAAA